MYGKIFESIYDGTLRCDWKAMIVFQQLIVLADRDGVVDITPYSLHGRTGIPLDIIEHGLSILETPDVRSRSTAAEGRRLARLSSDRDWGWRIVNYRQYAELASEEQRREQNREAKRRQRAREEADSQQKQADVSNGQQPSAMSAHVDVDVDIDSTYKGNYNGADAPSAPLARCPQQQILDLWHSLCPHNSAVRVWNTTRAGLLRARWKEMPDVDEWRAFFALVASSRFLTGQTHPTADRPPFVASLDWCLRPNNFAKIIEGKYANR